MPRPTNKSELLALSQDNFKKLNEFIESLDATEQQKEFTPGTMNRNIRDVLMHLYHWHLMMIEWYQVGMSGEKPDIPAKGYTWKTVPELNHWIWERYKGTDLDEAKSLVTTSHNRVRKLIESHSDKELFEKKRYSWTGSTSLGAYLISATSSHYDWALKLIKKTRKSSE